MIHSRWKAGLLSLFACSSMSLMAQSGLKPVKEKKKEIAIRGEFEPLYGKVSFIHRFNAGLTVGLPLLFQTPDSETAHIASNMIGFTGGFFFDFEFFSPAVKTSNSLGFNRDERGNRPVITRKEIIKGRPHPLKSFGLFASLDFLHTQKTIEPQTEIMQTILVSFILKYYIDLRYVKFLSGKIGNKMTLWPGIFWGINPVFHNVVTNQNTGYSRTGSSSTLYLIGPAIGLTYRLLPEVDLIFVSKTGIPLNPSPSDAKDRNGKRGLQQYFQIGVGFAL